MALDAEDLKSRACAETGLEDFGDAPLDVPLTMLCGSLAEEARLSTEGLAKAEGLLLSALVQRLRLEAHIARHPEILDQKVAPILLLIGMPRSGTTAFSQHLSEDPRARSILRWEAGSLVPPERDVHTERDPRLIESRAAFEAAFKAMPWRQALLPNNFDDPAEHGTLMGLTFLNLQMPTLYRIPTYEKWAIEQDLTPAYLYLAKVLKVLQAQKPAHYWNLKLPPDLFALDTIDTVFPATRYIWSHRNPLESMSSVCSLCATLRDKQSKAEVDPAEVGPMQLDFQSEAAFRAMAARDRLGEDRFIDVYQAALSRDVVGSIADLYARLGMDFADEYRARLASRLMEKPRGRFGKHEHHLDQYGITEADVLARFEPYVERFKVPLGG